MARQVLTSLFICLFVWLTGCGNAEPPAPRPIQECKNPKLLQEVTGVVSNLAGVPIEDMKSDMRLVEDLGIGGPGRSQLRMDLEQAFGIKIFPEEIQKARTVSELAAFVDEKLKKK